MARMSISKCDYWVHVYCLGFLTNDAESMTKWYCRKNHPIKCLHIKEGLKRFRLRRIKKQTYLFIYFLKKKTNNLLLTTP